MPLSVRMNVAKSSASRPLPTTTLPVTTSGGHAVAHPPVHVLVSFESFSSAYSVMPFASTSILPTSVVATLTVAFASEAAAVVVSLAAVVADGVAAAVVVATARGEHHRQRRAHGEHAQSRSPRSRSYAFRSCASQASSFVHGLVPG